MQMRGDFGDSEIGCLLDRGQGIVQPEQNRLAVCRLDHRPGIATVETPDRCWAGIGMELRSGLLHIHFVEHLRRKLAVEGSRYRGDSSDSRGSVALRHGRVVRLPPPKAILP